MANPRKAIRDAVVAELSTNAAVLALSPTPPIESGRIIPLDDAKLPRVLVYIRGETATELLTRSPREYRVVADLIVEFVARVKVTDGPPEDELDAVAGSLEAALDVLETSRIGGLALNMSYKSTAVAINVEGERSTVSISLNYEIEFGRVVAPVLPDDFLTTEIEYLGGDASPDDNPADSITLPQ